MQLIHATFDATSFVLGAQPDLSGGGLAPPGADKVTMILRWVLYLVTAACIFGALRVGGKMAGGGEDDSRQHGKNLGWVLAGCLIVGSATGITGALI